MLVVIEYDHIWHSRALTKIFVVNSETYFFPLAPTLNPPLSSWASAPSPSSPPTSLLQHNHFTIAANEALWQRPVTRPSPRPFSLTASAATCHRGLASSGHRGQDVNLVNVESSKWSVMTCIIPLKWRCDGFTRTRADESGGVTSHLGGENRGGLQAIAVLASLRLPTALGYFLGLLSSPCGKCLHEGTELK